MLAPAGHRSSIQSVVMRSHKRWPSDRVLGSTHSCTAGATPRLSAWPCGSETVVVVTAVQLMHLSSAGVPRLRCLSSKTTVTEQAAACTLQEPTQKLLHRQLLSIGSSRLICEFLAIWRSHTCLNAFKLFLARVPTQRRCSPSVVRAASSLLHTALSRRRSARSAAAWAHGGRWCCPSARCSHDAAVRADLPGLANGTGALRRQGCIALIAPLSWSSTRLVHAAKWPRHCHGVAHGAAQGRSRVHQHTLALTTVAWGEDRCPTNHGIPVCLPKAHHDSAGMHQACTSHACFHVTCDPCAVFLELRDKSKRECFVNKYFNLCASLQGAGPLRITAHSITWRTSNGGKAVEIKKDGKQLHQPVALGGRGLGGGPLGRGVVVCTC